MKIRRSVDEGRLSPKMAMSFGCEKSIASLERGAEGGEPNRLMLDVSCLQVDIR